MKLRRFTDSGIQEFRNFLAACREEPATDLPVALLGDNRHSQVVDPGIEVEQRVFVTKGDAAHYLSELLRAIPESEIITDAGLWTWLSLYYFDEICRPDATGYHPRNNYQYVFDAYSSRYSYRHLLFISWRVLNIAPVHNRLMLSTLVNVLDAMTEEIMKRLYFTRIPCMFELLDRLYWDSIAERSKKGAVSQKPKPGDLKGRLPFRIRQLEKTYDLQSLSADQLMELLGDEFQRWLVPSSPKPKKSAGRQPA